jgi:hypothetical protein
MCVVCACGGVAFREVLVVAVLGRVLHGRREGGRGVAACYVDDFSGCVLKGFYRCNVMHAVVFVAVVSCKIRGSCIGYLLVFVFSCRIKAAICVTIADVMVGGE